MQPLFMESQFISKSQLCISKTRGAQWSISRGFVQPTFCDCWKSEPLTRALPMRNSEGSVLLTTSNDHFPVDLQPQPFSRIPPSFLTSYEAQGSSLWLGCFQDLCFTNKVTFFKNCKMYQATKVGFGIPIKQPPLLSKCSSRKEVKKRFQMMDEEL